MSDVKKKLKGVLEEQAEHPVYGRLRALWDEVSEVNAAGSLPLRSGIALTVAMGASGDCNSMKTKPASFVLSFVGFSVLLVLTLGLAPSAAQAQTDVPVLVPAAVPGGEGGGSSGGGDGGECAAGVGQWGGGCV